MSEPTQQKKDSSLSISFSELLGVFFRAVIQAVRDSILFLLRYKFWMLLVIVAGIVMGILNYKIYPAYYRVTMIVSSNEVPVRTYGQMMANLNTLAETGSYEVLSKSLKLSKETCSKISSIGAVNMAGLDIRKDTASAPENSFLINMTVYDIGNIDSIQMGVLQYFNGNEYLTKMKNNDLQIYRDRLEFLDNELKRMDSLMVEYNKFLGSGRAASSFYNNAFNPADLYDVSNDYSVERGRVMSLLQHKQAPLLTIDGVKASLAPVSMSLKSSILLYAVIFFFAGWLLAGVFEISKRAKNK
jgi:hypothetical protein